MTKLLKVLLVVFGIVAIGGIVFFVYLNNQISADSTVSPMTISPAISLTSTVPATPGVPSTATAVYDWDIKNPTLVANYYQAVFYAKGDARNQINITDVTVVAATSPTGVDGTTPLKISTMTGSNGDSTYGFRTVTVVLNGNQMLPDTIYHWTIKPHGSKYTAPVDTKFLTASTQATGPTVTGLSQASSSLITMTMDKSAACKIELMTSSSATSGTILYSGVSYGTCSADLYSRNATSVSLTSNGTSGLNPAVKTQQTFAKMLELYSRYSSSQYWIRATATNTKGQNSLAPYLAINHIFPVAFDSINSSNQVAANTFLMKTGAILGTDRKILPVNTPITVTVKHNGGGATTISPTPVTDASGKLNFTFVVDPTKNEFIDFSATYPVKSGTQTINLPILNSKFILTNY